jgi:hypothetical protein
MLATHKNANNKNVRGKTRKVHLVYGKQKQPDSGDNDVRVRADSALVLISRPGSLLRETEQD